MSSPNESEDFLAQAKEAFAQSNLTSPSSQQCHLLAKTLAYMAKVGDGWYTPEAAYGAAVAIYGTSKIEDVHHHIDTIQNLLTNHGCADPTSFRKIFNANLTLEKLRGTLNAYHVLVMESFVQENIPDHDLDYQG